MTKKILISMLALFAIATTASAQGNSINGHEYVDLGLPSGLLWATCNVGATKPEEKGDYFAWGETTTKEEYSWATYKWCKGSEKTLTKYCSKSDYGFEGFTDGKTVLDPEDDAATAKWGGNWRMPTREEFQELLANTTNEWTTVNNVNGRKFTAKNGSGKSIFLPAAGCFDNGTLSFPSEGFYWSSSGLSSYSYYASYQNLTKSNVNGSQTNRCFGFSVRPVNENKTKIEAQCQPAEGGTVEGTGLYAVGSKATLTAKPNKGYKFVKWTTLSGAWQGAETTLTVNVPRTASGGSTWIAVFEKVAPTGIEINETNFPDANFRKIVAAKSIDKDEDGYLSDEEIAAVKTLDVSAKRISKLYGIGFFTALEKLQCQTNSLTALDLSENKNLKALACYGNWIKDDKMTALVNSLPKVPVKDRSGKVQFGVLVVIDSSLGGGILGEGRDQNAITKEQVAIAKDKNWKVFDNNGGKPREYAGSGGTTGLTAVESGQLTVDSWYSIDGVKLQGEPTKKGVYIIKGKKVVKK